MKTAKIVVRFGEHLSPDKVADMANGFWTHGNVSAGESDREFFVEHPATAIIGSFVDLIAISQSTAESEFDRDDLAHLIGLLIANKRDV